VNAWIGVRESIVQYTLVQ